MDLTIPKIMGVVNINADSFYSGSRVTSEKELISLVEKHVNEGVDIIDIGAMSSRPGALISNPDQEAEVIKWALYVVKKVYQGYISIDTVHSKVASTSCNEGAHIINDISSGQLHPLMLETVAKYKMPYIAMHMKGSPDKMQQNPEYENVTKEVIYFFSDIVQKCKNAGINDIIIDPGFGFGKTIVHNYQLLSDLEIFKILQKPLLIGISRKSMIYKLLNTTAENALNGTTAANTIALLKGANILRVHDVKEAKECIKIVGQISI